MRMYSLASIVSGISLAVFLTSCGQKEAPSGAPTGASTPTAPAASSSAAAQTEFTIKGNDQMQYDVSLMVAPANTEIRVTLQNVGKLPKVAMGHNWVLLAAGTDPVAFGVSMTSFQAQDYVDPARTDVVLAHTKLLGPGESDTITFKTPAQPGDYPYLCTFPGHAAVMKGILRVQ